MSLLLRLEDFFSLGVHGASQGQSLLQMKGVAIVCDTDVFISFITDEYRKQRMLMFSPVLIAKIGVCVLRQSPRGERGHAV